MGRPYDKNDIRKNMNLDREISKKALTDGFCLLYGEEYRELFDSVGEELIELGIENGRLQFKQSALTSINNGKISYRIQFFEPNDKYKNVEDLKTIIRKEFDPFLSKNEINDLFIEQSRNSRSTDKFAFPFEKDIKGLFQKIPKALENIQPKPVQKNPSFLYFKQFPIYDTCKKSLTLASESGFGLSQFDYDSVKYYLEENEEVYLAEAIPYKYHQLGSTLVREELRLDLLDKIKKNITINDSYEVKIALCDMIKVYCFDSEEESTLLEIQNDCGDIDGFKTAKQIHKSVLKMSMDKKLMEDLKNIQMEDLKNQDKTNN